MDSVARMLSASTGFFFFSASTSFALDLDTLIDIAAGAGSYSWAVNSPGNVVGENNTDRRTDIPVNSADKVLQQLFVANGHNLNRALKRTQEFDLTGDFSTQRNSWPIPEGKKFLVESKNKRGRLMSFETRVNASRFMKNGRLTF